MAQRTVEELNIKLKIDWDKKTGEVVIDGLDKLSEKIKQTGEKSKKASVSFKELVGALGLGQLAAFSAYDALGKVVDILKQGIKQALENEIALSKLGFRLQTLGEKNIKSATESLAMWSDELSKVTIFEQTEVLQALEQLIKYTGDVASGQKLTITALKLAQKEHKDLIEVVNELGTAYAMPEFGMRRLRREYGSLVGDAKNVSEALENITKALDKQGDGTLTLEQKSKRLAKIWREEIVEKAGRFWLERLNEIYDLTQKVGDVFYDLWKRAERFYSETIGRVGRAFKMSLRQLDEYDKEAEKIRQKEIEFHKKRGKNLEEYEKKFKDVQVKTKKDIEKEVEDRKKIEDKINEYLNRKKAESFEGAVEVLNKEVEEFRKTGVRKELIEKYYQERLNEIKNKFLEEEEKRQKELVKQQEELVKQQEELVKQQYEKIRDIAEPIVESIVDGMKEGLVEMVDQGDITAESFEKIWDRIKKSFVNAITSMVAEYVARMAVVGTLGMLFPGVGMGGFMSALGYKGKGLFGVLGLQEGGIVTKPTLAVVGEKGAEAVIPLDKAKNFGSGEININVNAWDLRFIDRQNIERLARQLVPVLKKELNR